MNDAPLSLLEQELARRLLLGLGVVVICMTASLLRRVGEDAVALVLDGPAAAGRPS